MPRHKQKGSISVEFAFVAPVVIVLILGLIETGNLFYSWLTTYKAAQAGARFASTGQGEDEGTRMALIRSEVAGHMDRLDGGAEEIVVSSWPMDVFGGDGTPGDAGDPCGMVQVEVAYAYHPITPVLGGLLPEIITLTGSERKINEPWHRCDQ